MHICGYIYVAYVKSIGSSYWNNELHTLNGLTVRQCKLYLNKGIIKKINMHPRVWLPVFVSHICHLTCDVTVGKRPFYLSVCLYVK